MINIDLFKTKTHFDLRHSAISPDNWEKTFALASKSKWIKGSLDLADVYNPDTKTCYSVKSIKIEPQKLKKSSNRDFFSHPEYFHFNGENAMTGDLDNICTVNGRCSIPHLDEEKSSPEEIGRAVIERYNGFSEMSLEKYKCDKMHDVIIIHGESANSDKYLLRVMFFEHHINPIKEWQDKRFDGPRTKYKGFRDKIIGYDANGPHIGRKSHLGREQTCILRFYRKSEAFKIFEAEIPNPVSENFDYEFEKKFLDF
jgi:hypothetical protein